MGETMVERVAMALSRDCFDGCEVEGEIRGCEPSLCACRRAARTAIEVMREPTAEMVAVDQVHWGHSCAVCGGLKAGWQTMIDAALSEVLDR